MLDIPKQITTKPGVYIFRQGGKILYVGKAANLKKRLAQYINFGNVRLSPDLSRDSRSCITGLASYFRKNVGEKVKQMLREATSLDWIETSSEIEAFLKEAELIKKYRPKYNIVLRDDKNYFYVGITKERLPRVFITHQSSKNKTANYIGPFTSGASLKLVLKLLRRIFPYCTCKVSHKRPCLNTQIGRCPGYCCLTSPKENQTAEYLKNIKGIEAVLGGRRKKIIRLFKKEMKAAVKNQEFEKAAKLRNQIYGLENIFSHRPFITNGPRKSPSDHWPKIEKGLKIILGIENNMSRVEGYDISNISGQEATGSMVVFAEGKPNRAEYRKFRIKTVRGISDVGMLKEVVERRLNHPEWTRPDFMLIDGGRAQLNTVLKVLKTKKIWPRIAVAALAKREEELYLPGRVSPMPLKNLPQVLAQFLQRVRDESHRFARVYHHKLREASFRE